MGTKLRDRPRTRPKTRRNDLITKLSRLTSQIRSELGEEPIALVDTGAVIDLERFREQRIKGRGFSVDEVYSVFRKAGIPLYVTSEVLGEVEDHHSHYTLNGSGHPEISREANEAVRRMHANWVEFLANGVPAGDLDQARYDAYFAAFEAFEEGHKKRELDLPSSTDRELIAAALWTPYFCSSALDSSQPSGVAVLSSDAHIINTIKFLTDQANFLTDDEKHQRNCYENVKAYSTREI